MLVVSSVNPAPLRLDPKKSLTLEAASVVSAEKIPLMESVFSTRMPPLLSCAPGYRGTRGWWSGEMLTPNDCGAFAVLHHHAAIAILALGVKRHSLALGILPQNLPWEHR